MIIEPTEDFVLPPVEDDTPEEIAVLFNRHWMAFVAPDDGDPHFVRGA